MTPTQQRSLDLFVEGLNKLQEHLREAATSGTAANYTRDAAQRGRAFARQEERNGMARDLYTSLVDLFAETLTNEPGPRVGDGTPDAALAIAEHAFISGWTACENWHQEGGVFSDPMSTSQGAWDLYDPPEHIKAMS